MSEEKKFKTLEEILEVVEPKNVFAVVEVEQGFESKNNLEHAVRVIGIVERVKAAVEGVTVRNSTAYLQPTPKGHAKIMNRYVFVDPNGGALKDIALSDITIIYRLDGRCEISHLPSSEKAEFILLHTVVD